jgi:hypothetical protein
VTSPPLSIPGIFSPGSAGSSAERKRGSYKFTNKYNVGTGLGNLDFIAKSVTKSINTDAMLRRTVNPETGRKSTHYYGQVQGPHKIVRKDKAIFRRT